MRPRRAEHRGPDPSIGRVADRDPPQGATGLGISRCPQAERDLEPDGDLGIIGQGQHRTPERAVVDLSRRRQANRLTPHTGMSVGERFQ